MTTYKERNAKKIPIFYTKNKISSYNSNIYKL